MGHYRGSEGNPNTFEPSLKYAITYYIKLLFTMNNITKQHVCITFGFKNEKYTMETFILIKLAFESNALTHCVTFKWFKCFKEDRIFIEDDQRLGRPLKLVTGDNCSLLLFEKKLETIYD